jgi:hypothetical protein
MSLFVIRNALADRVWNDLRAIVSNDGALQKAGGTTADGREEIAYEPSMPTAGAGCVAWLAARTRAIITIRGAEPNELMPGGSPLWNSAGLTQPNVFASWTRAATKVSIVYDPDGCNGQGYYCFGEEGQQISFPSHVVLFHELTHALHMATGTYAQGNEECQAIADEDFLRIANRIDIRDVYNHQGGAWSPC